MSFVSVEVARGATEIVSGLAQGLEGPDAIGHLALRHDAGLSSYFMGEVSRLRADGSDNPAVEFVSDYEHMLIGSGLGPEERADHIATVIFGSLVKETPRAQVAGLDHYSDQPRRLSI